MPSNADLLFWTGIVFMFWCGILEDASQGLRGRSLFVVFSVIIPLLTPFITDTYEVVWFMIKAQHWRRRWPGIRIKHLALPAGSHFLIETQLSSHGAQLSLWVNTQMSDPDNSGCACALRHVLRESHPSLSSMALSVRVSVSATTASWVQYQTFFFQISPLILSPPLSLSLQSTDISQNRKRYHIISLANTPYNKLSRPSPFFNTNSLPVSHNRLAKYHESCKKYTLIQQFWF